MSVTNPISGIDKPLTSLNAVLVTGAGAQIDFSRPRRNISMQVVFTSNPTIKIALEGTIDGTNWFTLATFDTTTGNINKDIIAADFVYVISARANLITLSGGTSPNVSATVFGYE